MIPGNVVFGRRAFLLGVKDVLIFADLISMMEPMRYGYGISR
jgi:hypothetical protein